MKLGISLYPEQENFEEIVDYLSLAAKYGFKTVFSSMFSVPGEKEEVLSYFKKLCDAAHTYGMEVCIDANTEMFHRFGASENDLSVFKKIGIDEIRMDFCFGDERDLTLINNKEKIKIQFSSFMVDLIKPIAEKLDDKSKMSVCYNFYPQRYTGVSRQEFREVNALWKTYGLETIAFISSNEVNAHGPWPVKDGLPTLEEHRYRSVDFQMREMLAMGNVDVVIFGNAFASEAELRAARKAIDESEKRAELTEFDQMVASLLPNVGKKLVTLKIDAENDLSDVEKTILYDFGKHCDLGDSSEYMLRARSGRTVFKKQGVPYRPTGKTHFEKGDVLIVNDNLKHYCGELQICLKPMANDGQRNYAGTLNADEMHLLDCIEPGDYFTFK